MAPLEHFLILHDKTIKALSGGAPVQHGSLPSQYDGPHAPSGEAAAVRADGLDCAPAQKIAFTAMRTAPLDASTRNRQGGGQNTEPGRPGPVRNAECRWRRQI